MSTADLYDEKELLRRFAGGEEQAFNMLYDRFKKNIYQLVFSYTQDREDAIEVTQRIFIKLWERRSQLAAVDSLKEYIMVAARNATFDYLKEILRQGKLIAHARNQVIEATATSEETVELKALSAAWHQIIQVLPQQQRQVYQLVELEGRSIDEVAEALMITKLTAKTHLKLARRYVREEMKKELLSQGYSGPLTGAIIFLLFMA